MTFHELQIFIFNGLQQNVSYVRASSKLAKAHLESCHRKTTGSDFKDSPYKIRPYKRQARQRKRNRNPYLATPIYLNIPACSKEAGLKGCQKTMIIWSGGRAKRL